MQNVMMLLLAIAASAALMQRASYRLALEDYHSGNWAAAYERFADLANRGDPQAAGMALVMYRTAPAAARADWDVEGMDLSLWTKLAEAQTAGGE